MAKIAPTSTDTDDSYVETAIMKEYRSLSSWTAQQILWRKSETKQSCVPWSTRIFAVVALLDISGFTKLASILRIEELKYHINLFFSHLIGEIKKYNGDVVKFCGDSLMVIWPSQQSADSHRKSSQIMHAISCILECLECCGQYRETLGNVTVTLKLHCALSAGELHCMCLGNQSRMEFLIAGEQFRELSLAEARADTGQLCLAPPAHLMVRQLVTGRMVSESGIYLVDGLTRSAGGESTSSRESPSMRHLRMLGDSVRNLLNQTGEESNSVSQRKYVEESAALSQGTQSPTTPVVMSRLPGFDFLPPAMETSETDDSCQIQALLARADLPQAQGYECLMERFVHESARLPILNRTTEHLSELRVVVTIFVHLTNLDSEFNMGLLDRPQSALLIVLDILQTLGGSLRQFVVDDKGSVLICCFGVPGCSSQQDELRAVYSALCMRQSLEDEGISCRIGIAKGLAYCGYVGSVDRKEYCVMGSSVNMAARLMGKATVGQVLVSGAVYLRVNDEFTFEKLSKMQVKGYSSAVPVYSVKHLSHGSTGAPITLELAAANSITVRDSDSRFIERAKELNFLQESFSRLYETTVEMGQAEQSNKIVISGVEGAGKSMLIRQFLDRNRLALHYVHSVWCHVANMLEPYDTIRQLLKVVFLKTEQLGSGNRDPEGDGEEDNLFNDDARFEMVYHDLYEWATSHLGGRTVSIPGAEIGQTVVDDASSASVIEKSYYDRTSAKAPRQSGDFVEADENIAIHHFFRSHSTLEHVDVFPLVDLLPLVRVILDTRVRPSAELLLTVPEDRLTITLQMLIVELLSFYISSSGVGAIVVEDVQWADRLSFDILRQLFLRHNQNVFFLCSFRTATSFGRKVSYLRAESFEGGAALNSLDEMAEYSSVLSLALLTKGEVKMVLECVLGPVLIASVPNVLSEGTVQSIYSKSGNGVASNVMRLAKELEASVSVMTFDSHAGQLTGSLPAADARALNKFDELSLDCQIVLKTASVCGTSFKRNLLKCVLARLGHCKTICVRIDTILNEIEDAGLIRRVSGADYAPDGTVVRSTLTKRKRNSVGQAMNITYSFTEKNFMDSIYGVMLDKQHQEMHCIVANVMEENIAQSGECMSCNAVELLAFHYSRADNVHMEARYTELAAVATYNSNMLSVSFDYYHHLVTMAAHERTVKQLIRDACTLPNSPSLFGAAAVHNLCAVPEVPLDRHYISSKDYVRAVHSRCPHISDDTLSDAIAEMSCVKYKQCQLMESHNLMLLSLHVRGICLSPTKNLVLTGHRLLKVGNERMEKVGKELVLQADSSIIRGYIAEAAALMKLSLSLLRREDSELYQCGCALFSTVLLLQNKRFSSRKWFRRVHTQNLSMGQEGVQSIYYSHINLHIAIRSIVLSCDFHAALISLSTAITPHLVAEDCSPLKYSIWTMSTWLYFMLGRPNKAAELVHSLPQRDKDNVLMRLWLLQFKALSCIMRGLFDTAGTTLVSLKTAQKGRMGSTYHSALVGVLRTCKKDHLSPDADTRDECINVVIFATTKLAASSAIQAVPIAIVALFLSAHCAVSILSQLHQVVGLRQGGGVRFRLMRCIRNAQESLARVAKAIPFVSLLAEALQMKMEVVQHRDSGVKSRNRLWQSNVQDSSAANMEKKLEQFRDFKFGLAFWHTERCQHFMHIDKDFHASTAEAAARRSRSLELLQIYGVPTSHYLMGTLSQADMSM